VPELASFEPRSTLSPSTDAAPHSPLRGTRIVTLPPATSETAAARTCTRCDRLLSRTPSSRKARKTGTGSHATTRQPIVAAYSANQPKFEPTSSISPPSAQHSRLSAPK